ncbi:hypothetical protein NHH03_19180 [Stieleria sp. TO1_6]|uniref:hypothetical protein n=1 Tax=Stieleria tagensis TaxID=2956795 RepID=UPI00209A6DC9|nr:hypothetical protein [Stieleria tagensis]MCO8123877.1 hypothetical protein [Stieleria tagensis]
MDQRPSQPTDDDATGDTPAVGKTPVSPSLPANPAGQSPPDEASTKAILGDLNRSLNRLQREIRLAIQAELGQMAGRSLGSLEANRELAHSIQTMLDSHGLRVRCNQCDQPAILRVSPRSGATAGVFVFDHTIDGRRTFHGGRIALPEIRLVAKPARQPRGKNNSSAATERTPNKKKTG